MLHTDIAGKFPIVAAVSLIEKFINVAQPTTLPPGLARVSATHSAHYGVPAGGGLRPKRVSAPEVAGKPK